MQLVFSIAHASSSPIARAWRRKTSTACSAAVRCTCRAEAAAAAFPTTKRATRYAQAAPSRIAEKTTTRCWQGMATYGRCFAETTATRQGGGRAGGSQTVRIVERHLDKPPRPIVRNGQIARDATKPAPKAASLFSQPAARQRKADGTILSVRNLSGDLSGILLQNVIVSAVPMAIFLLAFMLLRGNFADAMYLKVAGKKQWTVLLLLAAVLMAITIFCLAAKENWISALYSLYHGFLPCAGDRRHQPFAKIRSCS